MEFLSVCVQERTVREKKREVGDKPDGDKGLCGHECHTNKAQLDLRFGLWVE